jgi:hypothetical protein
MPKVTVGKRGEKKTPTANKRIAAAKKFKWGKKRVATAAAE